MCIPVAAATLAITAASAVLSYAQGQQQMNAAYASAERSNAINAQAYATQQQQINAQTADEMSQRAREALIERGRLRVLAAESGIVGNSTDQLERQSFFNEGSDMATLESNRQRALQQSYLDAQAGTASMQSRVNMVKQPSLIGTGLQIAGAYATYKTPPGTTTTPDPNVDRGRNAYGYGPV